jgi:hypothetical protein
MPPDHIYFPCLDPPCRLRAVLLLLLLLLPLPLQTCHHHVYFS